MNQSMAKSLAASRIDPRNPQVEVAPRLHALAAANLVVESDCFVLSPLAQVGKYDAARFHDRTGYECLANKIHVVDYLDGTVTPLDQLRQAIAYATELGNRLSRSGFFLVILGVDRESGDAVVRFHQQRSNETWLTEDLEKYEEDDILVWERGDFTAGPVV